MHPSGVEINRRNLCHREEWSYNTIAEKIMEFLLLGFILPWGVTVFFRIRLLLCFDDGSKVADFSLLKRCECWGAYPSTGNFHLQHCCSTPIVHFTFTTTGHKQSQPISFSIATFYKLSGSVTFSRHRNCLRNCMYWIIFSRPFSPLAYTVVLSPFLNPDLLSLCVSKEARASRGHSETSVDSSSLLFLENRSERERAPTDKCNAHTRNTRSETLSKHSTEGSWDTESAEILVLI